MEYDDLSFAKIVAPGPEDKNKFVPLTINKLRVQTVAATGQINRIFEMFYNVMGIVPPVNNAGYHERETVFPDHWGGLRHSSALFSGIKRPFNNENEDDQVFVYVMKPRSVYRYAPGMVCVAKREDAPVSSVFVAYVKFEDKYLNGEVLNWEWVTSDSSDPSLPENHDERYNTRIW